jgi:Phospholipase_D-nuclease N-terminal
MNLAKSSVEFSKPIAGAAMKLLTALLVVLAVVVGIVVLIPIVGFFLALALPLAGFLIWLLPILIILCSDKTTGGEKLAWILAIVFLSWFAWIFYFLLAPIKPRSEYRRYRYRYD